MQPDCNPALHATAAVVRDGWDWIGYGVAVAAGVAALVGFLFWILQQRRRPEVDFLWRVAPCGDLSCLTEWHQDYEPDVEVGTTIIVEASIQNIGDSDAGKALANFVVPDCFDLSRYQVPPDTPNNPLSSDNPIAGTPNGFGVKFLAPERARMSRVPWNLGDGPGVGQAAS